MSKETLSRRDFLATALKTMLAAILGGIVKVVPEARPAVASQTNQKNDRGIQRPSIATGRSALSGCSCIDQALSRIQQVQRQAVISSARRLLDA